MIHNILLFAYCFTIILCLRFDVGVDIFFLRNIDTYERQNKLGIRREKCIRNKHKNYAYVKHRVLTVQ
jgi:hypothetical protein